MAGRFSLLSRFFSALPAAILRISGPKSWRECLRVTLGTVLVLSLGFLLLRVEGIICLLLALPLGLALAILGAYMGYLLLHKTETMPPVGAAALMVVALATSLLAETKQRQAPTYDVSNSVLGSLP